MGPNPIGAFIKEGNLDTDTDTGRRPREDDGRCLYKPRNADDCQETIGSWGGGLERDLSHGTQKGPTP